MAAPCALIASCADYEPKNIVKHILNTSELPDGHPVVESIVSYDWHIDTKYYTADVHLCTTDSRTFGDKSFAESVEAFVVYFDSNKESSFEKVSSWLPYLAHMNAEILILVCQTSRQDDTVSRHRTLEWCIKHGFELVELEPEENSGDEDDDFVETVGPKRIVQALHAHTWPNLTMKSRSPVCSPYFRNLMQEEAALKLNAGAGNNDNERSDSGGASVNAADTTTTATSSSTPEATATCQGTGGARPKEVNKGATGGGQEKEDKAEEAVGDTDTHSEMRQKLDGLMPDDNELVMLAALSNEDTGDESFEQLFARLELMKDVASNLPPEERKSYAEKFALSFWRAVGGDEDEIDGLCDDTHPALT
ncbi:alpha- and gamma-adaptin-binding protein p34-like [Littorina saxatilis]|uniref:Alpha-and gamma-adaptin-binding protein p34 n=1 Tax=Littorina saxatilis TaxID=31220 RepID=A0AAN9C225_9CAEN